MRRTAVLALASALALLGLSVAAVATAGPAAAEPTTSISYPKVAASTHFKGYAFDACAAPSVTSMTAWKASTYRALGVYVGGENRTCLQPNLTAPWVSAVSASGWKLMPVYVGKQAPCTLRTTATRIDPAQAGPQGAAAAVDSVNALTNLGMTPGSIVYYDMENYDDRDLACRRAVLTFLSGFTKELHRRGYLAGVYGNLGAAAAHLSGAYTDTRWARPDVLWLARWDGSPKLTGWKGIPDTQWATYQRAKQYVGDHDETWNGVKITVDSNYLDAPVATVVRTRTATGTTNTRSQPRVSGSSTGVVRAGDLLAVVCRTTGGERRGTRVWHRLANGRYVSASYVDTTAGVPSCFFPYQVSVADSLTRRAAPKPGARAVGTLRTGALAWVTCQTPGAKLKTSRIWDKVAGGGYVNDYYVANGSNTTYRSAVPRC